jgi:hypothetical protein
MSANIVNYVVFSLNVSYTGIFTVDLNLFHMRGLNILRIDYLNKNLAQCDLIIKWKPIVFLIRSHYLLIKVD